jgi:hypothetical protein
MEPIPRWKRPAHACDSSRSAMCTAWRAADCRREDRGARINTRERVRMNSAPRNELASTEQLSRYLGGHSERGKILAHGLLPAGRCSRRRHGQLLLRGPGAAATDHGHAQRTCGGREAKGVGPSSTSSTGYSTSSTSRRTPDTNAPAACTWTAPARSSARPCRPAHP